MVEVREGLQYSVAMAKVGALLALLTPFIFAPCVAGGRGFPIDSDDDDSFRIFFMIATQGYCLDIGVLNSAAVHPCAPFLTSQWWSVDENVIKNHNGQCLSVCVGGDCNQSDLGDDIKQVILQKCDGGPHQKWKSSGTRIVSALDGHCLEKCTHCGGHSYPYSSAATLRWDALDKNQLWTVSLVGAPPNGEFLPPTNATTPLSRK